MDLSKESSDPFTSNVFCAQPLSNQSKINESLQNELRNDAISHNNFPVNKVMVLSPYIEKEPELISSYNQVVLDKDKGKKREYITERDFCTVIPFSSLNTIKTDDENYNHNKNKGKGKDKEYEHITERDYRAIFPSISLNTMQADYEYNIPEPTSTKINHTPVELQLCEPNYVGCIENERDFPAITPSISSNTMQSDYEYSISETTATKIRPVVNHTPVEQQLCESSSVGCIKKVISFFNSYDDTFNIVIDFSDKYQEIFPEDSFHLQPFHNNPYVLLEILNNLLLNRLNLDDDVENLARLEHLAEEYYVKLTSAGIYVDVIAEFDFAKGLDDETDADVEEHIIK
ncbi:hypothetical protein C1645_826010 [Glomus cerebriforme]|uniref:Uncharacterized protein n=1 Tax=Glomus cerebriforme TaxID=658196 RepID=A0A397SVJ8_9GLOM|nr:hypothetical protein C1645_826010 [Glomus cerebriforme]